MRSFFLGALLIAGACFSYAQNGSAWTAVDPGFRAVNITSSRSGMWVCGVAEGISSSEDGQHWQVKHHVDGGALLLGMHFASDTFGYAFGTGGTVVTTTDGGATWASKKFGTETILQAAFADPTHGIVRTRTTLAYLNGDGVLHAIHEPADALQRFPYTMSVAAITPEKMAVLLSQGQASEAGFLSTLDGGKTWSVYDPPNTGIASFVGVNGLYWVSGHEVVDKDKPGGGHSVPLAMSSADGRDWKHTTDDIHMCQTQTCGVCTASGCLASDSLVVNFYGDKTTYLPIPKGALTSKWASAGLHICSVGTVLSCATASEAKDLSAPGGPLPAEQIPAPLNAKPSAPSVLTCVLCSISPIYVDDKLEGRIPVPVSFTVDADGTVQAVDVKDISSPNLQKKVHDEIAQWLFEPPMQNGKPSRISTNSTLNITVMRSK
ncbi:MAG TPA: energy transducer TonB [Edaphobacter sp.]|jgi:photosystem II stability/assembly factor-like uncharacterized protein